MSDPVEVNQVVGVANDELGIWLRLSLRGRASFGAERLDDHRALGTSDLDGLARLEHPIQNLVQLSAKLRGRDLHGANVRAYVRTAQAARSLGWSWRSKFRMSASLRHHRMTMTLQTTEALAAPEGTPTACTRCGVFVERSDDVKFLFAKPYCSTCAARPDVDYLEAFRLKYWGKRDVWAWLMGLGVPFTLLGLVGSVSSGAWLGVPGQLASLIVGVAFFLGRPWARWGGLIMVGLNLLPALTQPSQALLIVGVMAVSALIWVAIIQTTLNKLFFKVDVSRQQLQQAWDLYANNTLARTGFLLGLLSLLVWPLGAVALPLSIVGLLRVDPNASPPIGRKGQAIAGIVVSSIGLLVLLALVVSSAVAAIS